MSKSEPKCAKHLFRQAIGRCDRCLRTICDLCVNPRSKNQLCPDCRRGDYISKLIVVFLFVGFSIGGYYFFSQKKESVVTRSKIDANAEESVGNEPCDRVQVLKRCNSLILEGKPRLCLNLSDRFLAQCGDYDQLYQYRNVAARRLSDWSIALAAADKLITAYPYNANLRWMRGNTYEEKGDFEMAINDYQQIIALEPKTTTAFNLAGIFQRLGKPCDAITPLSQFVFHNPNVAEKANRLLDQLYKNPKCSQLNGNGKATIRMIEEGHSIVSSAKINGTITGKFIIDTGASVVVLSKTFADRLNIPYRQWPTRLMHTAGGIENASIGFVDSITLQGLEANHVEVAVMDKLENIDGLLGMSFLGRFKIKMDAKEGYIQLSQNI